MKKILSKNSDQIKIEKLALNLTEIFGQVFGHFFGISAVLPLGITVTVHKKILQTLFYVHFALLHMYSYVSM